MSLFQKIIEHKLKIIIDEKIESEDIISRHEAGFMKGAGTEINILKLRVRARDLMAEKRGLARKYIFFIDMKKAYDSVNHEKLMAKLEAKGLNTEIVNTIRRLYNDARIQVDPLCDRINVNTGVLQSSLISSMLFNIYIDYLIRALKVNSYDSLGYADDLVVICFESEQLDTCMDILAEWSETNGIDVNKKKSGIMAVNFNMPLAVKEYRGYPYGENYKYLDITINNKLSCPLHLHKVKAKLDEYFSRNKKLQYK
jgi:hypothetical protein